jgi:hypothetical protein
MTDSSSWDGQVTRRSHWLGLQIPVHIEYFIEDPERLATDTSSSSRRVKRGVSRVDRDERSWLTDRNAQRSLLFQV